MKLRLHNTKTLIALAALAAAFLLSCTRQSSANPDTQEARVEKAPAPSVIQVENPSQFPLATVEMRKASAELKVNGVVSPDVNLTVPVLSLTGGRVVDLRVRLGDSVQKGQVLVRINSPDVSQVFADYQKFKADEVLAQRQLDRSRDLYARGAIAQRDLEAAEDAAQKAKVDVATSVERLRALGADVNSPSPILEVRAPIAGTIVGQNVANGAGVRSLDASPDLFTIADLSRVWILCDVYENNLSQVSVGDFADVHLNAYPDRLLRGRIGNISRVLDPLTRTAKVRLELDNPAGVMRAGMFAVATFRAQTEQQRAVVPAAAVLRLHDKDWVFRSEGGKKFRRVEIQTGAAAKDGSQQILAGLSPGDKVVINALQFASASGVE